MLEIQLQNYLAEEIIHSPARIHVPEVEQDGVEVCQGTLNLGSVIQIQWKSDIRPLDKTHCLLIRLHFDHLNHIPAHHGYWSVGSWTRGTARRLPSPSRVPMSPGQSREWTAGSSSLRSHFLLLNHPWMQFPWSSCHLGSCFIDLLLLCISDIVTLYENTQIDTLIQKK